MENLIFSLNATIPIFLVMVVGYVLKNKNILDEPFTKTLNQFNYQLTLPLLLFQDISTSNFSQAWDTKYVVLCFIITLICIAFILMLSKTFFKDKILIGEFVQASYRGSAAVLGIAFIQNIYGSSGMAPLMIIGTVPLYNIAAVLILCFTGPQSEGLTKETLKKSLLEIIKNPIIIAIVIGMVVSIFQITFPFIINKTLSHFAVLATPLALIGLGAGFEGKKALSKLKPTLIATFIKLFVQPALFLPLAAYMGFRDEKMVAILIMLGAPTTVSCYIMAKNMNHEGTLTSSVVVATTFLSSVSMTFWLYLLKNYGFI